MSNLIYPLPPLRGIPARPSSQPAGALAVQTCPAPLPAISAPPTPPAVQEKPAAAPPAPLPSARCSVKGCVFPAPVPEHTMCHYHELLQSDAEAEHFQSQQPTLLLSLYAPFGIPDEEPDDSRHKDRKRQAAEREAFLLGDEAA